MCRRLLDLPLNYFGRKVTVFSKTKESKWVASLVFDPKELLKRGNEEDQQGRWKVCFGLLSLLSIIC